MRQIYIFGMRSDAEALCVVCIVMQHMLPVTQREMWVLCKRDKLINKCYLLSLSLQRNQSNNSVMHGDTRVKKRYVTLII